MRQAIRKAWQLPEERVKAEKVMSFKMEFNMQIHEEGREQELQRKRNPRASGKVCPVSGRNRDQKQEKQRLCCSE